MADSLGKLGYAAGINPGDTSTTYLDADIKAGTGTTTSLGNDFDATFDSVTGANNIALGVTEVYTANFTADALFTSIIKPITTHYSWSLSTSGGMVTITPNGATCSIQNTGGDGDEHTLSCTFDDHFHGSTQRTKKITLEA